MSYIDGDGLLRKYGTEKAVPNVGGEFRTNGQLRELNFKLTLSALTQLETPVSDQVFFPSGARIAYVKTVATTGAATGTAIDLGLVRTDRTTEIDFDGLLAAAPTANMNTAGETSIYQVAVTVPTGLTGTGALIGTSTSNVGYVTCSRTDATAFTAGVIEVTIGYYVP